MKVSFRRSFAKDLKKIRQQAVRNALQAVIEQLEQRPSLADIPNVKPLTSEGFYYRIRIGDYRLGFVLEEDIVTIIRFLHRRDIYRYFP